MHLFDEKTESAFQRIAAEIRHRFGEHAGKSVGKLGSLEALRAALGDSISQQGLGVDRTTDLLLGEIVPHCIDQGHPRSFAAIPSAATPAATLCDLVISATNMFAGTWASGSGAIFAENQVLRWLADLAGLPSTAGGTFVSGGTVGILAALIAARSRTRRDGRCLAGGGVVAASQEAHFAVDAAVAAMDGKMIRVPTDAAHRMTDHTLQEALEKDLPAETIAVVATAGTPNLGVVDDLESIARFCQEHDIWLHVDGTYGFPAILSAEHRSLFAGIEHADSLSVDPHKWLFTPYDSCALLYRNADDATAAHAWSGAYLGDDTCGTPEAIDPKDFALHLSRRPRGLPLWFSLASHGTDAYRHAVAASLNLTRRVAEEIDRREELELLLPPALSVILCRRRGWSMADYQNLSRSLRDSGKAWFLPTEFEKMAAARFALINPETRFEDVSAVLDAMR